MRVLHLVRSGPPGIGGLEASVDGLARAQAALGHEMVLGALSGGEGVVQGVRRVRLRRGGLRAYPFAVGLRPWLRWADVVHVHGLDGLADQVVGRHPRVGVSTHGAFFHTARWPRLKRVWASTVTRRTLGRAGAVWFTSAADRDALGLDLPGEILGDGVDPAELTRRSQPVPGRWVVPGRVDVHKGIDRLLDRVRELHEPVSLRVVGPESRRGLVRSLARRGLGLDLTFVGPVSREVLLEELSAADRVVLPSRAEGFGIAALEAMTMGVPLIWSDIPAFRELCGGPGVDFDRPGPGLAMRASAAPADVPRLRDRAAPHDWVKVAGRFLDAYTRLGS